MQDLRVQPPHCTKHVDCGTDFAAAYFVIFIIVVAIILFNLLTAVVLENFAKMSRTDVISNLVPE